LIKLGLLEWLETPLYYKNSQGDNSICSTRDKISQPFWPFSPRAATASKVVTYYNDHTVSVSRTTEVRANIEHRLNLKQIVQVASSTVYLGSIEQHTVEE